MSVADLYDFQEAHLAVAGLWQWLSTELTHLNAQLALLLFLLSVFDFRCRSVIPAEVITRVEISVIEPSSATTSVSRKSTFPRRVLGLRIVVFDLGVIAKEVIFNFHVPIFIFVFQPLDPSVFLGLFGK